MVPAARHPAGNGAGENQTIGRVAGACFARNSDRLLPARGFWNGLTGRVRHLVRGRGFRSARESQSRWHSS